MQTTDIKIKIDDFTHLYTTDMTCTILEDDYTNFHTFECNILCPRTSHSFINFLEDGEGVVRDSGEEKVEIMANSFIPPSLMCNINRYYSRCSYNKFYFFSLPGFSKFVKPESSKLSFGVHFVCKKTIFCTIS